MKFKIKHCLRFYRTYTSPKGEDRWDEYYSLYVWDEDMPYGDDGEGWVSIGQFQTVEDAQKGADRYKRLLQASVDFELV